jgi:hypothetical protein
LLLVEGDQKRRADQQQGGDDRPGEPDGQPVAERNRPFVL